MRVISGYLFGCADTLRPCKQIDPVTLKVIGDGPEMRLPSAFLTDGEVSQVLSWGLSSYTNTAMALTSTRVLASNGGADAGFKSVRVLDRSEVPITGIRGGFALHGTATPDGKHAYLVLTQASGGQAIDVAKLKSLSTDCGSATLKAKRMLDLAMAPLQ